MLPLNCMRVTPSSTTQPPLRVGSFYCSRMLQSPTPMKFKSLYNPTSGSCPTNSYSCSEQMTSNSTSNNQIVSKLLLTTPTPRLQRQQHSNNVNLIACSISRSSQILVVIKPLRWMTRSRLLYPRNSLMCNQDNTLRSLCHTHHLAISCTAMLRA